MEKGLGIPDGCLLETDGFVNEAQVGNFKIRGRTSLDTYAFTGPNLRTMATVLRKILGLESDG